MRFFVKTKHISTGDVKLAEIHSVLYQEIKKIKLDKHNIMQEAQ